jgi:uncharacterized protein YidB (DUF937 family)
MGLLDDLLGAVSEQPSGGQPMGNQPRSGGGMSQVMIALMPVVLGMLANRGGSSAQATSGAPTGGGLGGLLGGLLGGSGGGGSGSGGLGDLLTQFQRAGFGDQAGSWVGRGQNQPLPADALEKVFGRSGISEIARRAGVSDEQASSGLSQLIPEVVDHVTPDGKVPSETSLVSSVDALCRRYGVS